MRVFISKGIRNFVFFVYKVFFVAHLISCTPLNFQNCIKDYAVKRKGNNPPSLVVINRIVSINPNSCGFKVQIVCSVFKDEFIKQAILTKTDSLYTLQFLDTETKPFILFNLSSKVGTEKIVEIASTNGNKVLLKDQIRIVLEEKILNSGCLIYKFRIKDFFLYEDSWFDIVYFVSSRRGVVGTYFSTYDSLHKEIVIDPRGEICREKIDYSKTKEGVFR